MSIKSIKKVAGTSGMGTRLGSTDIVYDSDAQKIKFVNNAGTVITLEDSGSDAIADDTVFGIGTDSDGVLYHRTTILGANTALATVVVGTPVTPAIAANSTILSNITASGDFLLALNNGGNSQAWVWVDSSAGLGQLLGAGVAVLEWQATLVEIPDLILFTLGNDNDQAFVNKSTSTLADTALTGVLVGTPVTDALAANSLIIGNITASGDILIAANRGGNSEQYLWVDSSVGILTLAGMAGGISLALAADQPAPDLAGEAVHIWDGTAGAVTAQTDSRLIIESNDATANYMNFLSPNAAAQGVLFGDVDDNDIGFIKYDHATNRLNVTVSTVAVAALNNANIMGVAGVMSDKRTSSAVSDDSNVVYTAAQLLTGIVTRTGITANRVDAADTAANIVAAIPGAVAGQSFWFVLNNNDDASTVTFNGASTGITYEGTATALAAGDAWHFLFVLTNVTGGMEAVTVYQFAK